MDRQRLAAVVHKQLLASFVNLSHGQIVATFPLVVAVAEAGVATASLLVVDSFLLVVRWILGV
jgi:NADH:ubiquinone oxidoreductase subunit K